MERIYFDNAATTPLSPEVLTAMMPFLTENFGNPSSIYAEGRKSRAAIEGARKVVANSIGASLGEIFFTSCGTESNNMALKRAVLDLGVRHIISAATEHHCVLHTIEAIAREEQIRVTNVRLDAAGRPDLDHLEEILQSEGGKETLVSLMYVNNETGQMIDLARASAICKAHGALLHCDTVQALGFFPIDVQQTPLAFLSGSAHKFHGPKGVGFVYINSDYSIKPYLDGGGQERNMRAGTENLSGIVGLAAALDIAVTQMESRKAHIQNLRQHMVSGLREAFPDIRFLTDIEGASHYKILNVCFPLNAKTELLLMNLDITGISASGGSACSSGAEKGSHVLAAMLGEDDTTCRAVRFSFSYLNTLEEVDIVIEKLKKFV